MARRSTGSVQIRKRKTGTYFALRFSAYGERQFVSLGRAEDGWTQAKAEQERDNILADVRRGIWQPPAPEPNEVEARQAPSLHVFASEWLAGKEAAGLRPRTIEYLRWGL